MKKKEVLKDPFVKKLMSVVDKVYESDPYVTRRKDMDRWLKEYTGEWWDETNKDNKEES